MEEIEWSAEGLARGRKPVFWLGCSGYELFPRGIAVRDEGDGKSDAHDVNRDADEHSMQREGKLMRGGQGNDDPVHEKVNGDAIERAGDPRLID